MSKFAITLSACATIFVEAENYSEAEAKALNEFEEGREALLSSIETNGYEAQYDEDITEEYADEDEEGDEI